MSNPSNQPRGAMQVLPEIRGGALVKEKVTDAVAVPVYGADPALTSSTK